MRTSARDIINGALAVIALILLTANLFVTEGDEEIIKLTKKGSLPLLRSRLKVMLLVGLSVYLIVFGFDFIKFYNLYPMNNWGAPISVLERHSLTFELTPILNPSSSILTYFILLQLTRIIGILSVLSIVAYTSKRLNNAIAVLIAGMLIVFVPQIMVTLGFDIFNIINIFDVVTGNLFLLSGKGIFKLILCLFIIAYMQYLLYQTSKQ